MLEENGGQDRRDLVIWTSTARMIRPIVTKAESIAMEMTLGAVDHVDSMLADSEDEAMAKVARLPRFRVTGCRRSTGTGMFKLPDCSRPEE